MNKICFILYRKYPSKYSTAYNYYISYLSKYNYDIDVYCISDNKNEYEEIDNISIYRIKAENSNQIVGATKFAINVIRKMRVNDKKYDIIQHLAFPGLGLLIHPFFFKKYANDIILDVRATAVSSKKADLLSRIILNIQYYFYNHIFVISKMVSNKIFIKDRKIDILPIGVSDVKKANTKEENKTKKEYGINNQVVFIYVGNIHRSRNIHSIIQAFKSANINRKKLLIVGGGNDYYRLLNIIRGDDNIIITGYVDHNEIYKYYAISDIGIGYIPNVIQYKYQPAIKVMEYLSYGLPVLATNTPGNKELIINNYNGYLCNDNINDIKDGMIKIAYNNNVLKQNIINERYSIRYNYNNIVKNYLLYKYNTMK